jgi:hypothetical protein
MTDFWDSRNLQDIDYQMNRAQQRQNEQAFRPYTAADYAQRGRRVAQWRQKSDREKFRPYLIGLLWMFPCIFLSVIPIAALVTLIPEGFSGFVGAVWTSWLDIVTLNFSSFGMAWVLIVVPLWFLFTFLFMLQDCGIIVERVPGN